MPQNVRPITAIGARSVGIGFTQRIVPPRGRVRRLRRASPSRSWRSGFAVRRARAVNLGSWWKRGL
eukprot:6108239-Alexandrium_andersonii.AAC.1